LTDFRAKPSLDIPAGGKTEFGQSFAQGGSLAEFGFAIAKIEVAARGN
jgi:hypothetical protein